MILSSEKKPLDLEYAYQMRSHPYGIALYHPQPRDTFHPGMVGYFDSYRNWNHIIDLSEASTSLPGTLGKDAITPLENLPPLAKPEQQTWGPKLGKTTHGREIGLEAGVSESLLFGTTGVPIGLGACFRFESESSSGAILMTSDPVVHERFYHESPFKRWVVANAKRLLAEREELKEYELWVVTSTWSVEEAAVNCWRDQKKTVDVGFKVGFVELGEVAPKGGWVDSGSAEGWVRVKKDLATGDRRVVFFGGLKFKYRPVIGGLGEQSKRNKLRSSDKGEESHAGSVQGEDGIEYDLFCEEMLEDKELRSNLGLETKNEQEDTKGSNYSGQEDNESEDDW